MQPAGLYGGNSLRPAHRIEINARYTTADSSTFILPFSRAGNLIVIQGRADSVSGNFILDTGCPNLVLNLTYFRNYPTHTNDEERSGITGAEFSAGQTSVADFSFGPSHFYRHPAELANLGSIENTKGIRLLGLIGMELIRGFEMVIDYETNQIFMTRLGRRGGGGLSFIKHSDDYSIIPITVTDNRIMVNTIMGGKKLRLIIDSGAETNLLDSRLPDKIFENVSITGRTMLSGAGNTRIEVLKGDLNSLTIGEHALGSLPVLITNLEKTCFSYGGCVDGILGFDFLSLKKIGFNFVTNKMYLWK
jgi:hypothetical protein